MKFKIKGRSPASLIMLEDHPYTTINYYEDISRYQKLCEEVQYILQKGIKAAKIEVSAITYRVKSMESFARKFINKAQESSIYGIKDIAGVRLIHLYRSNFPAIEEIIQTKFKVLQKKDKIKSRQVDEFGYNAVHFLVTLKEKYAGARYGDFKDLICEIQVRTVMQDAWAIVAHHLSYKQESDVPKELRRKLNALSGLFETADDQFDQLRNNREIYVNKLKEQITVQSIHFLKQDINLDSLIAYLNWRFPDRDVDRREDAADLLSELIEFGYTRLAQIDAAVSRSYDAIRAYETQYPPVDVETGERSIYTPVGVVKTALKMIDERYLSGKESSSVWLKRIKEFRSLVKK